MRTTDPRQARFTERSLLASRHSRFASGRDSKQVSQYIDLAERAPGRFSPSLLPGGSLRGYVNGFLASLSTKLSIDMLAPP